MVIMGLLRFWRGLECLTAENEWLSRTGVIKLCVIGNEILVLCEDRNLYHANLENSSNTLKFQKISDINAIDIASNNRHLYYVDTFGQVFKCEPKSWELKEEIVIREDARNCLHGHKTPSHRVKIKSVVGGEFGILYISKCGQLWASGSMPQLSINSTEPEKVLFFEGRTVYQAAVGDKFGMVIVRKKICKDETDSENDEDVFTSSCLECQSATRLSSPSQVSLVGTCPLGMEVCKSSEDTSSTSAAHTHTDHHGAHTLTEDTSPSTEDSELTKIHFDENKKAISATNKDNSDDKPKSTLESVNEENSNVLTREVSVEDKPNMIFINTEAAKQFLTKQLSWVSAGEDYLVECTERPTRIIKENVSNLTNLVVEGVKTVGDKVATLSRHMSGSSETNDPLEAYQNLIAEELNPLMYSLTSNYKMDEIQMSSSTMSDKEHSQNIIHDRAKMIVKIGQNLLNSEIWVWGDANNGQLGTGDTVKRSQPITVPRLANLGIHKISCGKSHCAAITLDGRVFCWGHNGWHQVSTDSEDDKSSPQQFSANSNTDRARDLACGDYHTMVFTLDENLFFIGKYNTGFTQDAKNLKENIMDKSSLVIEQDFQKKSAKLNNRSAKKHQDFYSTLSADLNFNSHVLSAGVLILYRPQQYGQQETPAFQDLAIEQQFLEEMILVHQSLIRPLLKMTASIASNSSVFETLCSVYADIMYFTALNVLSFWKYTEGHKKATEIALIQNCDEHISLYEKYLNAVCSIIVINGFNVITSYLDVPAALNNLFNDKLPSSKQKNNKTISEGIIFCAILHPLSRLNTYKCMIQSLIKYNAGVSPADVQVFIEQKLVDVLSKWDSFNNSQEKKKNEANTTKVFWEGTGKSLEVFRSPERRLVRESKTNPLSLLHSGRFSSHWFILLNDVLIHVNGSTQNIHHLITLWVEPINDTDALQNAIRLITPEESFTVIAPTSQEKFRWLLDFQSAIKSSLNKSNSVNPPLVRTAIYTYTNKSQLYKDAVYSGRWLNGKLHGTGKMEWQDGRMYLGHFHNNQIHGQGRMELPNIGVYEGQWKDNLQNGFGVMKYSSGDVYEGYFKDGLAHGHGVRKQGDFTTSTATIYMGEWNQGVRQGYGVMDDIGKGEKYLGSWSDNKKNGCGLIVTLDGIYYEGVFMNDTLTGHGVMIFEDGTHYEGEFKSAGVFNGKGTLTFSSGDCIDGTFHGAWTDGVKINTGTLQMNVSNPAPPANSIPNSFGQLSVSPNQKWNGLFRHCFEQLGFPDNLLSAMVDQTLKLNNCSWNEKCWRNIAVVLSNAQDENVHTSSISMDMPKRSDNKSSSSERLDFIPKFGQTSLTMESYNEIKQYVSKACEVNAHPIGQLVSGCAAAFSASYGGVRVHPLLLSHSVVELKSLSVRIYSAVRLLFPALPSPDRHVVLRDGNDDEELNNDEVVSVSGIVQPLLLPRVHPSLHVLYALHHQKEDVTYWKRLLKWNRQTDVTLMAFLGIDQKFLVSYTAKTSVGSPPFSPVKDQLFSEAVDTLQQLKTTFCPMEKLLVIKSTFQKITFAVQKELGPTYLWTMDELFPVFHFVVVRARILQLGSEIHFIEDFLEPCMQNGELGIMFTTLKACYFQILQEKVTICD